jgi:hypothetical protein
MSSARVISEVHQLHAQDRPARVLTKGDDSEMLVDASLDGTQAVMLLVKHLMRAAISGNPPHSDVSHQTHASHLSAI